MEHLDAKAIRERLNSISLAIATLDGCRDIPHHDAIVRAAEKALAEISVLVTDDEMEEHGATPNGNLRQTRRAIRNQMQSHPLQPPARNQTHTQPHTQSHTDGRFH